MADPQADYEIELDDTDREWIAQQAERDRELAELKAKADANVADRELAAVQGTVAGVRPAVVQGTVTGSDDHNTITFMGRPFRIADRIGLMPMLKFSAAASVEITDPAGLAAMYTLIRDCIYEGQPGCGSCEHCKAGNEHECASYEKGDWAAFEDHAMLTKADAEDLFKVVNDVMELVAGRPTKPRGTSSAGRRGTRGRSTAGSSSRRGKGSRR